MKRMFFRKNKSVLKEAGRSMVEMLGVIAIIGLLSITGILGYRYTISRYQVGQVSDALLKAKLLATRDRKDRSAEVRGFLAKALPAFRATGAGDMYEEERNGEGKKVRTVTLYNVDKALCQELRNLDHAEFEGEGSAGDCTGDRNTVQLFFKDVRKNLIKQEGSSAVSGAGVSGKPISGGVSDEHKGEAGYDEPDTPAVPKEPAESDEADESDVTDEPDGNCLTADCSVCKSGFSGPECDGFDRCSGSNGNWSNAENACVCSRGYFGDSCEDTCSGRGLYDIYYRSCQCTEKSWGGNDCSERDYCSHGYFVHYRCVCEDGWSGDRCTEQTPNCVSYDNYTRVCLRCASGYKGELCDQPIGNTCNGHGVWANAGSNDGYCQCDDGFGGYDCGMTSSEACSGHGVWNSKYSSCECENGYGGYPDCSKYDPNICSGHGHMMFGYCACDRFYKGENCQTYDENTCGGHGLYQRRNCTCDSGWLGDSCEDKDPNEV